MPTISTPRKRIKHFDLADPHLPDRITTNLLDVALELSQAGGLAITAALRLLRDAHPEAFYRWHCRPGRGDARPALPRAIAAFFETVNPDLDASDGSPHLPLKGRGRPHRARIREKVPADKRGGPFSPPGGSDAGTGACAGGPAAGAHPPVAGDS